MSLPKDVERTESRHSGSWLTTHEPRCAGETTFVVVVVVGLVAIVSSVCPSHVLVNAAHPDANVAVAIYAAMGVIFGVLLAQVVVAAWSDFEDAKAAAFNEASALCDLIRLAGAFDEPTRVKIWNATLAYGCTVLEAEWPAMSQGHVLNTTGDEKLDALFRAYLVIAQGPSQGNAALAASLDELDELGDSRQARLFTCREHIPCFLWASLWVGGLLIALFAFRFDVANDPAHRISLLVFIILVLLMLRCVSSLDNPFKSQGGISPSHFQSCASRAARELGLSESTMCRRTNSVYSTSSKDPATKDL